MMKSPNSRIVLCFLLVVLQCATGQPSLDSNVQVSEFSEPRQALDHYLNIQKVDRVVVPSDALVAEFGEREIVVLLEESIKHSDKNIRSIAISTLANVAIKSSDSSLRREVLYKLLSVELRNSERRASLRYIAGFRSSDFTDTAKKLLLEELLQNRARIAKGSEPDEGLIRCVGIADVSEAVPTLNEIDAVQRKSDYNPLNPFSGRSALLALARLGESPYIDEAIRLVDEIPDRENRVVALQNLVYVRQPAVVEYLKKYLFSDVVYPRRAADVVPIIEQDYAYRALCAMLEVPKDINYSNFREWMKNQTSYTFKGE